MSSTKLSMIHNFKKEHKYYQSDHTHPNTELVFYLRGNGTIKIGDTTHDFHAGCVSVINEKTTHDERHNVPFEVYFLTFTFEHFQIPNGVYTPKNSDILERLVKQIYKESRSPKYAYNLMISSKIEELMVLLARDMLNNEFNEKIHECMLYLTENCHIDIDVKELSERYDIGYETFRHKFKKLYGMSPKNFIISKRLFKAYDLLITSKLSCTEVAYKCGFSDSAQFSKLFKRQFGVSPNQFKNTYKH